MCLTRNSFVTAAVMVTEKIGRVIESLIWTRVVINRGERDTDNVVHDHSRREFEILKNTLTIKKFI